MLTDQEVDKQVICSLTVSSFEVKYITMGIY